MLARVVAVVLALSSVGCGHRLSPPPVLDPDQVEARPRVDVYFDDQPFELQLLRPLEPQQPNEIVLASCARDCRLSLLPGRYRLRTRGDAPEVERLVIFEQSSRIEVTKGSSAGRITGLSMIISGGVATAGLPLGLYTRQFTRESDPTPAALAIVGASGLVTLLVGVLVKRASRTTVEIEPLPQKTERSSAAARRW